MEIKDSQYWIKNLSLEPHTEGGYFREVYRSPEQLTSRALPERFTGNRAAATSIYFLLEKGQFSAFHYLQSDETWVLIDGAPVVLHQFSKRYTETTLGKNIHLEQVPQITISHHTHFAAESTGDFSIVACFVAPGFDFNDFHFSNIQELIKMFPNKKEIIEKYGYKK